jgi:ligand-binding sensor domain-containing protein/serine phosphatase RsbU (regulator of sigma subunit)
LTRVRPYLCLLLALALACRAYSQTYNFHNYTVDDGLSQSQVLCMFQDSKGNIWFGTNSGGACRFDGNKFTSFTDKNGLVNNIVYSICEDKKGNILFGTSEGLSVYNGFTFKNFTDSTGLPHSRVYKVAADDEGVWIGTKKGVCRYADGHISPFTADTLLNRSAVWTIFRASDKTTWFGTFTNGLIHYDAAKAGLGGAAFRQYAVQNGMDNNFVRCISEDAQGHIWAGTLKGADLLINDSVKVMTGIFGGPLVSVTSSFLDKKGNLWFGTSIGAFRISYSDQQTNGSVDGKITVTPFTEKNGLVSNSVLCMTGDREGNIWFGSDGNGVFKLAGETFSNLSTRDSLPDNYITCVFQDSKKNMWIGTPSGLVRIDPQKKMTTFRTKVNDTGRNIAGNTVQCIYEDRDGKLWFGTKTGLSIYDGEHFRNYDAELTDHNIYCITPDKNGTVWIGTLGGACFYNGVEFETFERLNKEVFKKDSRSVYTIYRDRSGNLWFATDHGVVRYDYQQLIHYGAKENFTGKRVQSIAADALGDLWFGTDEGVFNYRNGKFIHLDDTKGLTANKVYLLAPQNEHALWIGTNKGLDKLDLDSFGTQLDVKVRHYGREEGFIGVECNSNSRFTDDQGRLWFGTVKGVTIYDPRLDHINDQEAKTHITGIRLFFQPADLGMYSKGTDSSTGLPIDLVLPYAMNHVTLDFIGVSLTIPSKVQYRYLLEGLDGNWIPPTSRNEATYSSLPPGDYVFRLIASNNDGLWNKEPVIFKFTILPPWYRTWWFYTLCVILAGSTIYAYITIRTRNLEKAKVELEQEVQLRTFQLRQEKEKVEVVNREVIEQKAIIEAKNRDITDSILYAKNIQEAILPPLDNFYNEFNDSFVLYLPKDIVSGDFYWFARRRNKRFIAAADCTGHGVPGAFMSIIGNALLNEIVTEKEILEPAAILNELHTGVKSALKQSGAEHERRDGMDIALCALTLPPSYSSEGEAKEVGDGPGVLEYAGANRALWMFRQSGNGELQVTKPDKFPIGGLQMEEHRKFTNHTLEVHKGDMIYIFSDGYADQFGGDKPGKVGGKKFMVKNFEKLLSSIRHLPMKEQHEILRKNFMDWKASYEQVDDVLVIGFRI